MARALWVGGLAFAGCWFGPPTSSLQSEHDSEAQTFVVTTTVPHEYVIDGQHVQRDYGSGSRETWRLSLGTREVRLTVRTTYDDGRSDWSDYRGAPDHSNGGLPTELRELNGQRRIKLECRHSAASVHERGAVPHVNCNADTDRFDELTGPATPIPVVECKQEFLGFNDANNILYMTTPLVFGDRAIERVVTECCAFDMCWDYRGLRFGGP